MVNVNKNDSGNYTCWPSGGALASVLLNVIDGKFNLHSKFSLSEYIEYLRYYLIMVVRCAGAI